MISKKLVKYVKAEAEDDDFDIGDIKKHHIPEYLILLFYGDIFSNYLEQKTNEENPSDINLNRLYRMIRASQTYIDGFLEEQIYPLLTSGLQAVFQRALKQPINRNGIFLRTDALRNAFLRIPATKLKKAFLNPRDYSNINKSVQASLIEDEKQAVESIKSVVIQTPQIKTLINKFCEQIIEDDYNVSVTNTITHITKETDSLSHIIQERENTPIDSPDYGILTEKEKNISKTIKQITNKTIDKDDSATKADVVELTSTMIANEKHVKAFTYMEPDEEQKAAIFASGKVVVAASAGSGKTQTLTTKVGYLIKDKNVDPSSIFVTTFTKNAANEMKERIVKQVGEYPDMFIGTQHSFGLDILKQHGSPEYKQAIKNTQQQRSAFNLDRLVGYAIAELQEFKNEETDLSPKEATLLISAWKYDLIEPDKVDDWVLDFKKMHVGKDGEFIHDEDKVEWARYMEAAQIYKIVETLKGRHKIMKTNPYYQGFGKKWEKRLTLTGTTPVINYDDMLCDFLRLLKEQPEVKTMLQKRYKHFIMDEAQDSNNSQLEIFKLMTEKVDDNGTAWLVGDDNQSIYAFRSAKPEVFINLANDPEWKVRKISTNYRCASNIVKIANELIDHNQNRIQNEAKPSRKNVGVLTLHRSSIEDMANNAITEIVNTIEIDPTKKNDDFSVIARTNNDLNDFEAACIVNNVPYTRKGGINFFNRKEIKKIIEYMVLALSDNVKETNNAILEIYDYPNRFLGEKFANALSAIGGNYFDLLADHRILDSFSYQAASIRKLHSDIINLKNEAKTNSTVDLLESILLLEGAKGNIKSLIEIDIRDEEAEEGEKEHVTLGGVSYLIKMMGKDSRFPDIDGAIPAQFFQKVKKMKETMKELQVKENGVVLSTIHAAKGLQYHKVFAVVKPPNKYVNTAEKLEEERRMAYVQITRAKDELSVLSPLVDANGNRLGKSLFITESGIDRLLEEEPEDGKKASVDNNTTLYDNINRICKEVK